MERYKAYLDSIEVPEALHQRLLEIPERSRKSRPSRSWQALAAAACLCLAVGAATLPRLAADAPEPQAAPAAVSARSMEPVGGGLNFNPAAACFQLSEDAIPSEVSGVTVYAGYVEPELWFAVFIVDGEEYRLSQTGAGGAAALTAQVEETIALAQKE